MDGTTTTSPQNHSRQTDVPFVAELSNKSSPVYSVLRLIHLHHEGTRWESLRDRMIMSPELRDNTGDGGSQGDRETWSTDEVFIRFLLDRLEKDLETRTEGNLDSDLHAISCEPQAETKRQKSRYFIGNSLRRKSSRQSRQPTKIQRANGEEDQREGDGSSKPPSVDNCKRGCRWASSKSRLENEEKCDKMTTTELSQCDTGPDTEADNGAQEAIDFTSDKQISKKGEDYIPLRPGEQPFETLQECGDYSNSSQFESGMYSEKTQQRSSAESSSNEPLADTEVELASPKNKKSQEDKEDNCDEKAIEREEKVKPKRRRGRPRIEVDEAEKEAMMFNKRLKEIRHQDLPRMFSCRSCGEQFQESEDLRIHTITAHLPISIPDNSENAIEENGDIQFTHIEIDLGLYQQVNEVDIRELAIELRRCPECHEYVENVKTHLEIHMMKNYICEECGKGFASCKQLQTHSVYHEINRTGIMPYSCDFCDKMFRTAQSLSIHRPLHNNARNFVCQQCGKTFKANTRLQKHLGTHATHKRYSCSLCGRGFAQKCNMTRHLRTHTGEKPYDCRHCDQRFNHNISLKRHLKKEHAIEMGDGTLKIVKGIDNFPTGRLPSKRAKVK